MEILRFIAISLISGLTAIIPGVSGGTIFAIFGISERMAEDINGLTESVLGNLTKSLKGIFDGVITYGKVPIIIGLGSLFSSLFYAKVLVLIGADIEYLLRFLFIGLVIFSLPTLWNETNSNSIKKSSSSKYIYLSIGFLIALILFNSNEAVLEHDTTDYFSVLYILKFFLISLVAGVTAILPGISGTNILIIGGVFEDYIIFSSNIGQYPIQYGAYLLAAIVGSIIAAKVFTILFRKCRQQFFSFMTGLTASTVVFIWLLPTTTFQIVQAIIGFGLSYLLIKTLNEREVKATSK